MAIKKKKSVKKQKLSVSPISATVRKRLVKVKGSARQYIDPKTKKKYSRRQFDKGRVKKPRKNAPEISRKYQKYLTIRDVYISAQAKKGKYISKRAAMNDEKLKKYIKDLHTKGTINSPGGKKRAKAWEKLTGGEKSEWVPYIKRWIKGEL